MKLMIPCVLLATSIGMYRSQGYGGYGDGTGVNNQGFRPTNDLGLNGPALNDPGIRGPGSFQGQAAAPVYANYQFDGYGRVDLGPLIERISDSIVRELQRLVDEEGYRFENFLGRGARDSFLRGSPVGSGSSNNVDSYFRGGAAGRRAAGFGGHFP